MKTSDFIDEIEALFKEYEKYHNVIIEDISINLRSIQYSHKREEVINHGIALRLRKQ